MARISPPPRSSSAAGFLLFLLFATALPPPASAFPFTTYRDLLSLSHSLTRRVANLRRARGDLAGFRRAEAVADRLERWTGMGLFRLMGSVGWDFARNYRLGRDLDYRELYRTVPELNELLALLGDFFRWRTEAERAAWIGRNYGSVLRTSKSIAQRLLGVFRKSGPMREAVEILQEELAGGAFLKDCLELGTDDLKGLIQILKDLMLQYNFPSDSKHDDL